MNALTLLGFFAVSTVIVFYALENRNAWFIRVFAVSCFLGSLYGFLQGSWLFGLVEAIWAMLAARRWWQASRSNFADGKPSSRI